MKPNFALLLSSEKVELTHRNGSEWDSLGEVLITSKTLDDDLAALRQKALMRDPDGLRTKLVLPDDQVKFIGLPDADADDAAVRRALENATPYNVDDLVYESTVEGRRTLIAAVARETLEEAEAFALAHHFAPVSITAKAVKGRFDGEPFFGMTRAAAILLSDGDTVERDLPPAGWADPKPAKEAAPKTPNVLDETAATPPETPQKPKPKKPTTPIEAMLAQTGDAAPETKASVTQAALPDEAPLPPEPAFTARPRASSKGIDPLSDAMDTVKTAPFETASAPSSAVTERLSRISRTDLSQDRDAAPQIKPADLAATLERRPSAAAPPTAKGSGGLFATRRTPSRPIVVAPTPAVSAAAAPVQDTPVVAKPVAGETVFDRQASQTRGKPRYMGLILTVLLIIGLLAVAYFAQFFETAESATLNERPTSEVSVAQTSETAPPEVDPDPLLLAQPSDATPIASPSSPEPSIAPEVAARIDPTDEVAEQLGALIAALPATDAGLSPEVFADPPAPEPDTPEVTAAAPAVTPETTLGTVPSPDEAARFYAATGVWLRAPRLEADGPEQTLADVDVGTSPAAVSRPSIPRSLPRYGVIAPDTTVAQQLNPPGPDVVFPRDTRGFLRATADGTRSPYGMLIYAGSPSSVPPTRPGTIAPPIQQVSVTPVPRPALAPDTAPSSEPSVENASDPSLEETITDIVQEVAPRAPDNTVQAASTAAATDAAIDEVVVTPVSASWTGVAPRGRPDDLAATAIAPGGVALTALDPVEAISFDGPRPSTRPDSLIPADQDAIANAVAEATQNPAASGASIAATLATIVSNAPDPLIGATNQAVARAAIPEARPRNFDRVVANARAQRAPAQTTAPSGSQPQAVSSAPAQPTGAVPQSVAAAATVEGAINLRQINLISVAGRPGDRRALIRMPNGQFVRVQVGDALDGGRVTAIGDNVINYVRRGNTVALGIPG